MEIDFIDFPEINENNIANEKSKKGGRAKKIAAGSCSIMLLAFIGVAIWLFFFTNFATCGHFVITPWQIPNSVWVSENPNIQFEVGVGFDRWYTDGIVRIDDEIILVTIVEEYGFRLYERVTYNQDLANYPPKLLLSAWANYPQASRVSDRANERRRERFESFTININESHTDELFGRRYETITFVRTAR